MTYTGDTVVASTDPLLNCTTIKFVTHDSPFKYNLGPLNWMASYMGKVKVNKNFAPNSSLYLGMSKNPMFR